MSQPTKRTSIHFNDESKDSKKKRSKDVKEMVASNEQQEPLINESQASTSNQNLQESFANETLATKDDSDDDLFGELNATVKRTIHKCDILQKGKYYLLKDIYTVRVQERLSIVGGFSDGETNEVTYIWLPSALAKNMTETKVSGLQKSIQNGKKGYILYKGKIDTPFGNSAYDVAWVSKPK